MRVYSYSPDNGENHCREGIAIVQDGYLFDTFWGSGRDMHQLTPTEKGTVKLLFDTDEFEEIDRYSRTAPKEWVDRAEADRAQIPSQHGLQVRWFIRKGSDVSPHTMLSNARTEVEDAAHKRRMAEHWEISARDRLAALLTIYPDLNGGATHE